MFDPICRPFAINYTEHFLRKEGRTAFFVKQPIVAALYANHKIGVSNQDACVQHPVGFDLTPVTSDNHSGSRNHSAHGIGISNSTCHERPYLGSNVFCLMDWL